jgi:Tfp pilus assembly ATPase PilU
MRDGSNEGMQHFDGVLDGFIRDGLVDFGVALGFASNSRNLRLELQDHLDDPKTRGAQPRDFKEAEIEIER